MADGRRRLLGPGDVIAGAVMVAAGTFLILFGGPAGAAAGGALVASGAAFYGARASRNGDSNAGKGSGPARRTTLTLPEGPP